MNHTLKILIIDRSIAMIYRGIYQKKSNNKELQKVEHIVAEDILIYSDDKDDTATMYQDLLQNKYNELEPKITKSIALQDTVAGEVLFQMANSLTELKKNKKEKFCKKLLISNTDGRRTYAFIYGLYNEVPFCVTFSKQGQQALNSAIQISKNSSNELAVFKNSEFSIYSVTDTKSCGTIALKIMKYLKYEDIKSIIIKKQ